LAALGKPKRSAPGKTQSVLHQDSGSSGRNDCAAQRAGGQLRECRRAGPMTGCSVAAA
jgi:hypothetical protein